MDLSKYVTQLREDLASAAAAGDEQTRTTASLLGSAIEPAARLALMNALSDLAAEVTAALGDREVDVRLDGRDVRVVVTGERSEEPEPEHRTGFGGFFGGPPPPPPPPPPGVDPGDISRITLRMVEQIKNQAEQAAAARGVSLNSWVAQAVQEALSGNHPGRHGKGHDSRGHDGKGYGSKGRKGGRDDQRLRGWVEG